MKRTYLISMVLSLALCSPQFAEDQQAPSSDAAAGEDESPIAAIKRCVSLFAAGEIDGYIDCLGR